MDDFHPTLEAKDELSKPTSLFAQTVHKTLQTVNITLLSKQKHY